MLDGSRSACAWGTDADAVQPGIFGPGKLPFLERSDYVENSNDSHWLSNPEQPLEGFARIIGDERTERSLRTRLGLRMIREHGRFALADLQELMLNDRNGGAELMRDELVGPLPAPPRSVPDRGLRGAGELGRPRPRREPRRAPVPPLRRALRALPPCPAPTRWAAARRRPGTWSDAFDLARPVDTPEQLNTAKPKVVRSR